VYVEEKKVQLVTILAYPFCKDIRHAMRLSGEIQLVWEAHAYAFGLLQLASTTYPRETRCYSISDLDRGVDTSRALPKPGQSVIILGRELP
jgi:hypothetical protein